MIDAVPSFYSQWIRTESLVAGLPDEARAFDCGSCFMLKPRGLTRDLGPFQAHLKCCTYSPFLPSFSLGSLLETANGDLEAEKRLSDFFEVSKLTPWGAVPRRKQGTSICETGRHSRDACVFLSGDGCAQCTIRSHRPAVCASYVCRSNQGAQGLQAWRDFEEKLSSWETTLATLVALEAGFTLDDRDYEFATLEAAKQFYRRAYKLAREISPDDIGL